MPAEMEMSSEGILGYQPVADGEDAVGVQCVPGGHAVLGDADDRAAHDIH